MQEPVLVLGAGGFIGSNIVRRLVERKVDVVASLHHSNYRLAGVPVSTICSDLTKGVYLLSGVRPRTIINCAAYGSRPQETVQGKIFDVNLHIPIAILNAMHPDCVYVHAGTSSEYGTNSEVPREDSPLVPNSDYAVSKACASQFIAYAGKHRQQKCCTLRLYSVYGPYEHEDRLIPTLVKAALQKKFPPFVNVAITRDFVYIDDVVDAFIAAVKMLISNPWTRGESYNICTGTCTSIGALAELAKNMFDIDDQPVFETLPPRNWDHGYTWCGDPSKTKLFWQSKISLSSGLQKTYDWYKSNKEQ